MARSRKKQYSRRTRQAKKKQERGPSRLSRILHKKLSWPRFFSSIGAVFVSVWKLIVALGVIVTIVVGAYSISSRLSLVPGVQPDSRSPLVGYFTLTNDGLTSIYSVSLDYNWPEIESPTFHANGNEVNVTNFEIPELAANQKHYVPVFFPTQAGSPRDVTKAEVLVKITFRPKFLWARQQIFHFAMFKDADGVVHWLPI